MQVNFFYRHIQPKIEYEIVIRNLCERTAKFISLPDQIDICIYRLNDSTYGGIDRFVPHRLAINASLNLRSIPIILVHELIHISQRHVGMLQISNDGFYTWNGKLYTNLDPELMPRQEYLLLPWEDDVNNRLPLLLEKVLDI